MRNEKFLASSLDFIEERAKRLQYAFKNPDLKSEEQEMLSDFLGEIKRFFEIINTIPSHQEKRIQFQIELMLSCVPKVISAYQLQSETIIAALHEFNAALIKHHQSFFPKINIKDNSQPSLPSMNLESMDLDFSGLDRVDAMLDLSGFPQEDLDLLVRAAPQNNPKKNNVNVLDLFFDNPVEDKETFQMTDEIDTNEMDSNEMDSDQETSFPETVKPSAKLPQAALVTYPPIPKNNPYSSMTSMSFAGPMTMTTPGPHSPAVPATRAHNDNHIDDDDSNTPENNNASSQPPSSVTMAHNFAQGLVPLSAQPVDHSASSSQRAYAPMSHTPTGILPTPRSWALQNISLEHSHIQ